jgi:aarF domain-containing kinase
MAGQLMVDTSSKVQASELDMELFIAGIEQIVEDDKENNFLEKVGDYITDICFLACRHKVKLEASFINAALAVEIMEGIATALSPDLIVTKVALPLVVQAEMMHRLPKFTLW